MIRLPRLKSEGGRLNRSYPRAGLLVFAVLLGSCFLPISPLRAADNDHGTSIPDADFLQSAECYSGVECLEQAATQLGQPLDMISLLTSKHLQPQAENLSEQLSAIAGEQGLKALAMDHIDPEQIAQCPYPLLLHIRGGKYSSKPDYFVLSRGVQGSEIHIFSPSLGEMSVPLSQLDEDRLGQAILLSNQIVGSDEPFLVAHRQIGRYLAMGVVAAAILLLTIIEYRRRPLRSKVRSTAWKITDSIMGGCGFAAAALVIGMSSQLLQGAPLLPTGPPVDSTGKGPVLDFMLIRSSADTSQPVAKPPEISLQSALLGLSLGETFVDARDLGEYNAGHIKGAICCPASDVGRWRMHMSGIDPKTRIVVYCAEASCGKGEYVATFLLENGFTDVSLYRAGWADWTGPKE